MEFTETWKYIHDGINIFLKWYFYYFVLGKGKIIINTVEILRFGMFSLNEESK